MSLLLPAFAGFYGPAGQPQGYPPESSAPVNEPRSPTEGIEPINYTRGSSPNQIRLGVVPILQDWWERRHNFAAGLPVTAGFVTQPRSSELAPAMMPIRRLDRIVSNRRVFYVAPEYNDGQSGGVDAAAPSGSGETFSRPPAPSIARRFGGRSAT